MSDLDRSIQNLGDKIEALAVQVSSLTNTVNRVERNLDRQIEETRELRLVTQKQTENIAQMSENIALVRTLKTKIMVENQYQIGVLTRLRHVTPGYGYIAQLIALAQQQQATVDRLLSKN